MTSIKAFFVKIRTFRNRSIAQFDTRKRQTKQLLIEFRPAFWST